MVLAKILFESFVSIWEILVYIFLKHLNIFLFEFVIKSNAWFLGWVKKSFFHFNFLEQCVQSWCFLNTWGNAPVKPPESGVFLWEGFKLECKLFNRHRDLQVFYYFYFIILLRIISNWLWRKLIHLSLRHFWKNS